MSKLLGTLGFLSLFAIQAQAAWPVYRNQATSQESYPTPGFNNEDNRRGFISGDYLYWVPHQDDLFYAASQTTDTSSPVAETHNKYKQPHFDWSSGFRLSVGGYTSDSWDIGLTGMYIHSDAHSHTHVPPKAIGQIVPGFNTNLFSTDALKSHASNHLKFGTLDFSIGREFFLTQRFAIHPLIGLRGFHMSQRYHAHYLSAFTMIDLPLPATILKASFKAKNSTYGIGPRAGIDIKFYMTEHFAFLGGLSGSLLWGTYRVHQRFFGRESTIIVVDGVNEFIFAPSILKTSEKNASLRTNIDAYFGLGYDVWFNCDKNRFYVALLFEASEWFAMNQFNDTFSTTPLNSSIATISIAGLRRHGDLGFVGGTLHLQIDF